MRKFKFLAFALFAVLACVSFVSCSDDDDKPANNSIVGTWFDERVYEDCTVVYEEATFKKDGTMTSYWRETCDGVVDIETNVGRYRLIGDELTLWWDNPGEVEEVKRTVVIEGNRLTLSWTAEVDGTPVLKTRVYQRK